LEDLSELKGNRKNELSCLKNDFSKIPLLPRGKNGICKPENKSECKKMQIVLSQYFCPLPLPTSSNTWVQLEKKNVQRRLI